MAAFNEGKLQGFEQSIMKRLQIIAELEREYVVAVLTEKDQGISKRKMFLPSRMIRRQIKNHLRGTQNIEKIHNQCGKFTQTNLVAQMVFENDVFEQSRLIIANGFYLHPRQHRDRKKAVSQLQTQILTEVQSEKYETALEARDREIRELIYGKEPQNEKEKDKEI
jgi:hypothetical protein